MMGDDESEMIESFICYEALTFGVLQNVPCWKNLYKSIKEIQTDGGYNGYIGFKGICDVVCGFLVIMC